MDNLSKESIIELKINELKEFKSEGGILLWQL